MGQRGQLFGFVPLAEIPGHSFQQPPHHFPHASVMTLCVRDRVLGPDIAGEMVAPRARTLDQQLPRALQIWH